MKPRQTYRKNSAEWMGWTIDYYSRKKYYVKDGERIMTIQAWQPDLSYDQMHMMINKLTKEGVGVVMAYNPAMDILGWYVRVGGDSSSHKDIRTAFRLACTEYQTTK